MLVAACESGGRQVGPAVVETRVAGIGRHHRVIGEFLLPGRFEQGMQAFASRAWIGARGRQRHQNLFRHALGGAHDVGGAHRLVGGDHHKAGHAMAPCGLGGAQGAEHVVEISKGVQLYVGLEAIGSPDAKGFRTVMTTLNGQLRPINVRDRKIAVDVIQAEKADATNMGHVAAPFAGVVTLQTVEGARVEIGQPVATIEAMKMEASITASAAGVVRRLAIGRTQAVEAGDLIIVVEPDRA